MIDVDADVRRLINSAVDAELGPRRPAPPLAGGAPARRESRAALWRMPVLAASVMALLATGGVALVSSHHAGSPTSATHSAAIQTRPVTPHYPDGANVDGVTVGPLTAKERELEKGLITWGAVPQSMRPGRSYQVTVRVAVTMPSEPSKVLSTSAADVSEFRCPQPFLVHPGLAYEVSCTVHVLAGAIGKLTTTLSTPGVAGGWSYGTFLPRAGAS